MHAIFPGPWSHPRTDMQASPMAASPAVKNRRDRRIVRMDWVVATRHVGGAGIGLQHSEIGGPWEGEEKLVNRQG
jgi:hypothetical protein